MTEPSEPRSTRAVAKLAPPMQWGLLIAASALLAALFSLTHLPAALLLGPMVAGIALATNGGSIRLPRLPVLAAQTVIGCLVARAITAEIIAAFLADWLLFLSVVLAMVAASSGLGWLLTRFKVLPGTTAVWGTAPGGASVMMLMASAFGADARLVALMQYLRVVMVAIAATLIAGLWVGGTPPSPPVKLWLSGPEWLHFAATLLIAGGGGAIGIGLRIPAGGLLVPMLAGAVLEATGFVKITMPAWLLAASYAFLGWSVGLGFTREILGHASRALLPVLLAILVIIAIGGGLALVLVHAAGIDPLTAYLATSPGGLDSVAIIAASSKADVSFVMALQTLRLVIVLIAGPPLARIIAQRMR